MEYQKSYLSQQNVCPIGLIGTLIIWTGFYYAGEWFSIPAMAIHPLVRIILIIMFFIDGMYLVLGGLHAVNKNGRDGKLVTSGVFLFVRHPLYSAIIYSITGLLAMLFYSWGLLLSAIPLSFFWSWLVIREERYLIQYFGEEYDNYCRTTGQFFPSFKNIKNKFK